jgi:hypothetical protein
MTKLLINVRIKGPGIPKTIDVYPNLNSILSSVFYHLDHVRKQIREEVR